jgi:hypothetical protein
MDEQENENQQEMQENENQQEMQENASLQEMQEIEPPTEDVKTENSSTDTPVVVEEPTHIEDIQIVPTSAHIESNVTVKCVILPTNQVITLAKSLRTTIQELMIQFSNDLKFELEYLQIIHSDSSKKIA